MNRRCARARRSTISPRSSAPTAAPASRASSPNLTKSWCATRWARSPSAIARHDPLGEITLVVAGAPDGATAEAPLDEEEITERAAELLARGVSTRDAADQLATLTDCPRREVYRLVVAAGALRAAEDDDADSDADDGGGPGDGTEPEG